MPAKETECFILCSAAGGSKNLRNIIYGHSKYRILYRLKFGVIKDMKLKLGTRKYYEDYYRKIDKEQHKRVSDQIFNTIGYVRPDFEK